MQRSRVVIISPTSLCSTLITFRFCIFLRLIRRGITSDPGQRVGRPPVLPISSRIWHFSREQGSVLRQLVDIIFPTHRPRPWTFRINPSERFKLQLIISLIQICHNMILSLSYCLFPSAVREMDNANSPLGARSIGGRTIQTQEAC